MLNWLVLNTYKFSVGPYVKPLSGVGYVSAKRTYPTPDSCLTNLFHGRGRLVV